MCVKQSTKYRQESLHDHSPLILGLHERVHERGGAGGGQCVQRVRSAAAAQSEGLVSLVSLAADQRRLEAGGPALRPVRTRSVAGSLAVVEEAVSKRVLSGAEELVLGVRQPDPQRSTARGGRHVLRYAPLPRALGATLAPSKHAQQSRRGHIHGRHRHVRHCRTNGISRSMVSQT